SLFLFTATAATEISTLSLHDALPIYIEAGQGVERAVDAVLVPIAIVAQEPVDELVDALDAHAARRVKAGILPEQLLARRVVQIADRKSTRLNSSHVKISYAVFCLKKK